MTDHKYKDSVNEVFPFQNEAGDDGGLQKRPVMGLPGALRTQFTNMLAALQSLATTVQESGALLVTAMDLPPGAATAAKQDTGNTSLASILTAVTGVSTAANQTSSNTKLDTLHSDLGTTIHADLATTLAGKLDTLHTDAGTTLHADLGTIATNQGVPSGGTKVERKTSVGTGVSTQFASQALSHGLTIFNESTTIDLQWGMSSGTSNYQVVPPRSYSVFIEVTNANAIFIGSASSTLNCSYSGA